jgi:hypothetical protein
MSTDQEVDTTIKQEQQRHDRSIAELRVAQSELVSGDTTGKVYVRLSEGAVGYLTDRAKVKADIATSLRQKLLNETTDGNKNI